MSFRQAGFRFSDSPLRDGRDRLIAEQDRVTLELIGPADNLEEVVLSAAPSNDQAANTLMVLHMSRLLFVGTPDWNGNIDWLNQSIRELGADIQAGEQEPSPEQIVDGKRVRLFTIDIGSGNLLFLSIRAAE